MNNYEAWNETLLLILHVSATTTTTTWSSLSFCSSLSSLLLPRSLKPDSVSLVDKFWKKSRLKDFYNKYSKKLDHFTNKNLSFWTSAMVYLFDTFWLKNYWWLYVWLKIEPRRISSDPDKILKWMMRSSGNNFTKQWCQLFQKARPFFCLSKTKVKM